MTDVAEDPVTLADLTGPTADQGGGSYEQFISPDEPEHDPFADYPDGRAADPDEDDEPHALALLGIPMQVSATLAHNLVARRQKIWDCYGSKVVVGWIGDASHQAECSDHNKDAAGVVHAIDPMLTGSRAQAVVNAALAHPGDLQYIIHNRTIWSATTGWKPRRYTGSNPHTDHVHISGKHGGANRNSMTCTGYDLGSQNATPAFDLCPAPKPPAPKPPVKPGKNAPGARTLIYGKTLPLMTGDDVLFVQRFIGEREAGKADGKYGPHTAAGVRWYRNMRGLKPIGEVDAKTWAQMGVKWNG